MVYRINKIFKPWPYIYDILNWIIRPIQSNCTDMSNFLPFEVVGRGSETHLQVGGRFFSNK